MVESCSQLGLHEIRRSSGDLLETADIWGVANGNFVAVRKQGAQYRLVGCHSHIEMEMLRCVSGVSRTLEGLKDNCVDLQPAASISNLTNFKPDSQGEN
jgi:hypothetical protein